MSDLFTEEFDRAFSDIDESAIKAYEEKLPLLTEYVNKKICERKDFRELTGHNPQDVMEKNHENHGKFMATVFYIKDTDSFMKTVSWVYSSYISRGFLPDYFPLELSAWMEGIENNLDRPSSEKINKFYSLMIKNHNKFLSHSRETFQLNIDETFIPLFDEYMESIIEGHMHKAVKVAEKYIRNVSHIPEFWLNVIEPSMYKTGYLWSSGEITVGQEHLASSITQRVMVLFYPMILEVPKRDKYILITASPGELHTIGSQIISDLLEIKGWNVYYMGADTPQDSIISFVKEKKVHVAGISTTMIYNIKIVENLIKIMKIETCENPVKIVVGGQAYIYSENLWKTVGADGFAVNASGAVHMIENFL